MWEQRTAARLLRASGLCMVALSMQGCAPNTDATPASTTTAVITREQITNENGIRKRQVFEVKDGIKEIVLEENKKDGKLHGDQLRYAKGRLIEELHYEDGKKVAVKGQEWLDEMNDLRAENCILEKTPEYHVPEPNEPPMSQAMLDRWNARCNERPYATDE
jgi:hypothetical protein